MKIKTIISVIVIALIVVNLSYAFEWEHIGLVNRTVLSLAVDPDDSDRILAGTDAGLYLTSNGGETWTNKISSNINFPDIAWAPLAEDSILCLAAGGSYSDGIYISDNGGIDWDVVAYYINPRQLGFDMEYDGLIYYCFEDGILKSENYGQTFVTANNGLPFTDISDVMGDGRNALEAYAAGTNFLAHTDNFANSWEMMNGTFNTPAHYPMRLAFEPLASETLYVSCSLSVAVSYNGGTNWNFTELDVATITPIVCNPLTVGEVYIGSALGGGVLKSTDAAASFFPINANLGNLNIHSLAITPDSRLLAGTENGVYIVDMTTVSVDEPVSLPESYKLSQNYPNPFNAQTLIEINLDPAEHGRLEIFDITGRLVSTLYDGYGSQTVIWDGHNENGDDVASGIYFYRLSTTGETVYKRMTLLR